MLKDSPFSGWEMPSIRIYGNTKEKNKENLSSAVTELSTASAHGQASVLPLSIC
jgi:hypothetical protein